MAQLENNIQREIEQQRERAQLRRRGRRKRFMTLCVSVLLLFFVLTLALPAIICTSPIANSLLARIAGDYGWSAQMAKIRFGWTTPLQITGLHFVGPTKATIIDVDSVQSNLRLLDLIQKGFQELGQLDVQGLKLTASVAPGTSSLEEDLKPFLQGAEEDSTSTQPLPNFTARITEAAIVILPPQGEPWTIQQISGGATSAASNEGSKIVGDLAFAMKNAGGPAGSVEAHFELSQSATSFSTTETNWVWQGSLQTQSLPLTLLRLAAIRSPELGTQLPQHFLGEISGRIRAMSLDNEAIEITAEPLTISRIELLDPRFNQELWQLASVRVEGTANWLNGNLRGSPLKIASDFASTELRGVVAIDRLAGTLQDQLTAFAGELDGQIDIVRLNAALPGLLPMRDEARLTQGAARLQARAANDAQGKPKLELRADTDQIAGSTFGKQVSVPPMFLNVIMRPTNGWPTAEKLELRSVFANASASGHMTEGNARFDLNLEKLAEFLRPLVDVPNLQLGGQASGNVQWAIADGRSWQLTGTANASQLAFQLPGGAALTEPAIDANIVATGLWDREQLVELSTAKVSLNDGGQRWSLDLTQPVANPKAESEYPLTIDGMGQLASLRQLIGPWLPVEVGEAQGAFKALAQLYAKNGELLVGNSSVELQRAAVEYDRHWYRPDSVVCRFVGTAALPQAELTIKSLTLQTIAGGIDVQGNWSGQTDSHLDAAFRVDFRQLGEILGIGMRPAGSLAVRPVSTAPSMPPTSPVTWVNGELSGNVSLKQIGQKCDLFLDSDLSNLTVIQLTPADAPPGAILPPTAAAPQILWHEKMVHLDTRLLADIAAKTVSAEGFHVKGDWFEVLLGGGMQQGTQASDLRLSGDLMIDAAQLAKRVEPMVGQRIDLMGTHKGPLEILASQQPSGTTFDVRTAVGWQSGKFASLDIGPATIPVQINDREIAITATTIPLRTGKVHLAGRATYASGPLMIEMPPGLLAENVQFDADLCRGWLKYVAPIAADATSVAGTFSLQLDQMKFFPNEMNQSIVRGRMNVGGAELGPGPLSGELLALIETIKAASRGQAAPAGAPNMSSQWIRLPEQTVDFALENGFVVHRNLTMKSGNVTLITSGSVGLNNQLRLVAQVPLETQWLGDNEIGRIMAGQNLQLPIAGTLSRPALNTAEARDMLARIGAQSVERAASSYLNRTLEKGLEKFLRPK